MDLEEIFLPINFSELELGEIIGCGSYAKVYKATWRNQTIACKKLFLSDSKRFRTEFVELTKARHTNIIELYGYAIKDDDIYYMLTEYADGGPLSRFLHDEPRLDYTIKHVINWALQLFTAVAYLHSMTVIHRDLKPANILLCDRRRKLKICDFGTVRRLATVMSNTRGTAPYMAPEVFSDQGYTEKCDVFSAAVTVWEMLARDKPFKEYNADIAILGQIKKGTRPDINSIVLDCPAGMITDIQNCWNVNPEVRLDMAQLVAIYTQYAAEYNIVVSDLFID